MKYIGISRILFSCSLLGNPTKYGNKDCVDGIGLFKFNCSQTVQSDFQVGGWGHTGWVRVYVQRMKLTAYLQVVEGRLLVRLTSLLYIIHVSAFFYI